MPECVTSAGPELSPPFRAQNPEMLPLFFESLTGNVRRFVRDVQLRCGAEACELSAQLAAPPARGFVLATYTFGQGQVPERTARFLAQHGHLLRGVAVSGSYHWGKRFGRAGDLIAEQYGVPLIVRIDKSGSAADRETLAAWLEQARGTGAERGGRHGTLD